MTIYLWRTIILKCNRCSSDRFSSVLFRDVCLPLNNSWQKVLASTGGMSCIYLFFYKDLESEELHGFSLGCLAPIWRELQSLSIQGVFILPRAEPQSSQPQHGKSLLGAWRFSSSFLTWGAGVSRGCMCDRGEKEREVRGRWNFHEAAVRCRQPQWKCKDWTFLQD